MEEWKEKIDNPKKLERIEKRYKYTTLNDEFVYKVLQDEFFSVNIDAIGTNWMPFNDEKGRADYSIIIRTRSSLLRLLNDFEIADMNGKVDDELSLMWRKGMIKYGLPLKGKDNIDVGHYLNDLYVFENEKLRKSVGALSKLAAQREADERELD